MRIVLIGADFEENLGLGIIAAVAQEEGHEVVIQSFNRPTELRRVASLVAAAAPDLVGLSIQFQHRAHEFLSLSRALRAAGYEGHMTSGGQFPTLACVEVLSRAHGVDSVVLHDGEDTFRELVRALASGRRPHEVPGLALLSDDGAVMRTTPRPLLADLDAVPFPLRYREHVRHHGVPFVPVMAGRGCWGKCTYCSIVSFYSDGRQRAGGPTFRTRSPQNVAEEMAQLAHAANEPVIFCFHDDNFLLPKPAASLERVRAIHESLAAHGVEGVGIVGKCRPETVTPELAKELAKLGVIRLYVGVENASDSGGAHLRRGAQTEATGAALDAVDAADIFACYNLLVFEPGARTSDVRQNVAFIRAHAHHPVNFCRAEPYYGTPLHLELEQVQDLGGSYLGWNYRIEDDRAELLFRICAAAFRERNFDPRGVANRYMGLGYSAKVLAHFYGDDAFARAFRQRARDLTRAISLDTANFLEQAIEFAESVDLGDSERIERETALLGLRISEADSTWHLELDEVYLEIDAFVARAQQPKPGRTEQTIKRVARHFAVGASLALWASSLEACSTVDPVPPDAALDTALDMMVVDPPPPDAAVDSMVVDPPPPDAAMDSMVVDPAPIDSGLDSMVVDPPPPDAAMDGMVVDPPPPDAAMSSLDEPGRRLQIIDQWRDSSPRRSTRTTDLPLFQPPAVKLAYVGEGPSVQVRVEGAKTAPSVRWQSAGEVLGEGLEVEWRPANRSDQLRAAVRTKGGVAVVTLRASSFMS